MKTDSVKRIREMETILDEANARLDALDRAISDYEAYQSEIKKLEAYYTSDDRKNDLALDEDGKLPSDLKRGVLSEDGIYNMLERNKEMEDRLSENGS